MSEPVTVTYMDLDRLIDTCGLSDEEMKIVDLLMRGWTKSDIDELRDIDSAAILNGAVDKIVEQNEYEWHRCQAARRKIQ